jgi:hypothetical protein
MAEVPLENMEALWLDSDAARLSCGLQVLDFFLALFGELSSPRICSEHEDPRKTHIQWANLRTFGVGPKR